MCVLTCSLWPTTLRSKQHLPNLELLPTMPTNANMKMHLLLLPIQIDLLRKAKEKAKERANAKDEDPMCFES